MIACRCLAIPKLRHKLQNRSHSFAVPVILNKYHIWSDVKDLIDTRLLDRFQHNLVAAAVTGWLSVWSILSLQIHMCSFPCFHCSEDPLQYKYIQSCYTWCTWRCSEYSHDPMYTSMCLKTAAYAVTSYMQWCWIQTETDTVLHALGPITQVSEWLDHRHFTPKLHYIAWLFCI